MRFLIVFVALLCQVSAWAQQYTPVQTANLEAKKLGCVAAGDLNNDGYLDIITNGITEADEMSTSAYINLGNGAFEKLQVNFGEVYNATISLGDYNNDSYLDILINGEGWTQQWAILWKNNGDLTFTEKNIGLDPLGGHTCEFRDFDNDGWLDVVLGGDIRLPEGSYLADTRVYRNMKGESFERVDQEFSSYARVGTFGDYDNDGDLDLAVGSAIAPFTLYPNLGNGSFGDPIKPELPEPPHQLGWFDYNNDGLYEIPHVLGQIKWFDYNNDGRLDLLVWGQGDPVYDYLTPFSVLLENTGEPDEPFRMVETNFTDSQREQIDIRDYNADGKSDILVTAITGFDPFGFLTTAYSNTGNGFVENTNLSLPQFWGGDALWLDHDNDGDLDIVMTGQEFQEEIIGDGTVYRARLLRNNAGTNNFSKNEIPLPPDQISWEWSGDRITITWNNGLDLETPVAALTYNIAIGTSPDKMDVLNPESDLKTGKRKIVRTGNTEHNLTKTIGGLDPEKKYYLRIQTIDGALAGSKFSEAADLSGIPDTTQNELIQAFPNPSDGPLLVNLTGLNEQSSVRLYSNTGQYVNVDIEQVGANVFKLDLSSLNKGIYFLDVSLNGKRVQRKIMKK